MLLLLPPLLLAAAAAMEMRGLMMQLLVGVTVMGGAKAIHPLSMRKLRG